MKKMIIAAMVLLVAQIGLTLTLNMGNNNPGAGGPDTLFLSFSPDTVHSLEITDGQGTSVIIENDKDGWRVPAHFWAPVDGNKVKELLDKLAVMKQGFVVATSGDAAKRFKVDGEDFENHVILKGGGKTLADFYVGTSPTFRQAHARRADGKNIVTVPLSSFELEPAVDKWLDTSVATINDEDLIGLSMGAIMLKKADEGWQLEGLKQGEKINRKEVDEFVTKARGLVIQDVLDPAKVSGLFDQPVFHFNTVRKGGKEVEYFFAGGEEDFFVLKLSDRDLYFKIPALPVQTLQKVTRAKLLEPAKEEEQKTSVESQKE